RSALDERNQFLTLAAIDLHLKKALIHSCYFPLPAPPSQLLCLHKNALGNESPAFQISAQGFENFPCCYEMCDGHDLPSPAPAGLGDFFGSAPRCCAPASKFARTPALSMRPDRGQRAQSSPLHIQEHNALIGHRFLPCACGFATFP